VVFLIATWTACRQQVAQPIPIEEYVYIQYDNGSPKEIGMLQDSVKQGMWITFYPNDKIQSISFYKDNKWDGVQRGFREDGSLLSYTEMRDDMNHGKKISYYSNGQMASESHWVNDTPHGLFSGYNYNGILDYIYEYENGKFLRTIAGSPPPIVER
jgi:antitoxin component YwqK of YwqJK toxin-antitoxin module